MSFANIETSVDLGEPIELYLFTYGPSVFHRHAYTDGERSHFWQNTEYRAIPIKRTAIVVSGTLDKAALTVTLPGNAEVPEMFRVYAPSTVVTLQIYQGHVNDPDNQFLLCWSGKVINTRWVNREASLTCEPSSTSLKRVGLRRNYQYGCPHALYDQGTCRASEAAATTRATVQTINGTLLSLSTTASQDHAGGKVQWVRSDGVREVRTIIKVVSGSVILSGTPIDLSPGMSVDLIRGCDHSLSGCAKHNNIANYGGMPWIPLKNPLGRTSPFR